MESHMDGVLRSRLIEIVTEMRIVDSDSQEFDTLLAEFQETVPNSDVVNLIQSDLGEDEIVDFCLLIPTTTRICTRDELLQLVSDLRHPRAGETEVGARIKRLLFRNNCKHLAETD